MSNFRTMLRGGLAAILWATAGLVIATDAPTEASAGADERRSIQAQSAPDTANTRAATEQRVVAEQDVKTMVESDVRLNLSQRLASFTPPS